MGAFASSTRRVALLLALCYSQVMSQAVTNGPGAYSFEGFYTYGTTSQALYCPTGYSFVSSGDFANCCNPNGRCSFTTACSSGTANVDNGTPVVCGNIKSGFSCVTMTVFPTYPGIPVATTNIFCGANWSANTIYKALPEPTTTSSYVSSSFSTASPSGTTSMASPTSALGSSQSSTSSANADSASSSTQVWIAGAVIGPVVGLVLIGLAFWYGMKRGRRNQHTADTRSSMLENKFASPSQRVSSNLYPDYSMHSAPSPSAERMHQSYTLHEMGPTGRDGPL